MGTFCIFFNKVKRFSIDGLNLHLLAEFGSHSFCVDLGDGNAGVLNSMEFLLKRQGLVKGKNIKK